MGHNLAVDGKGKKDMNGTNGDGESFSSWMFLGMKRLLLVLGRRRKTRGNRGRRRRRLMILFTFLLGMLIYLLVKLQFRTFEYLPFLLEKRLKLNKETGFLEKKNYVCNYFHIQLDWSDRALPVCSPYIQKALAGDEPHPSTSPPGLVKTIGTTASQSQISGEEVNHGKGDVFKPFTEQQLQACSSREPTSKDADSDYSSSCPLEWVSYTTSCNSGTTRLGNGLEESHIPLTVFGYGTTWKRRWGMRQRILHNYLLSLPPNKLVIFSDIDDVYLLPKSSSASIISTFERLVKERDGPLVIFGAEKLCFPDPTLIPSYPIPETVKGGKKIPSSFRFLNAGLIIGRAGHLIELLRLTYQGECVDDQAVWTNAFIVDPIVWWKEPMTGKHRYARQSTVDKERLDLHVKKEVLIGLDYWNDLFSNLVNVQLSELEFSHTTISEQGILDTSITSQASSVLEVSDSKEVTRVRIKETNSYPFIFHQNGGKDRKRLAVIDRIAILAGEGSSSV